MRWLMIGILALMSFTYPGKTAERISWNEHVKLSWSDFQGRPSAHDAFHAQAHCELDAGFTFDGATADINVTAYFLPKASWTIITTDSLLLDHEQLHFTIAELFARKLRKMLLQHFINGDDMKVAFDACFDSVNAEMQNMQNRYDVATNHGLDHSEQMQWQKNVHHQLDILSEYSDSHFAVILQ